MNFFSKSPAEQVASIMQRVYDRGLTTATGGNISIREKNGDIWITPKAVDKGSLTAADIVCVHPDGSYDGIHAPSSELPFHSAAYRVRPDFYAVVHAHPVYCIAYSLARKMPRTDLLPSTYRWGQNQRMSRYAMMGSVLLGDHISEEFARGADVVYLENHGVCVGGSDLLEAYHRFESAEYSAKLEILTKKLGEPTSLSQKKIALAQEWHQPNWGLIGKHILSEQEKDLRKSMVKMIRRACEHGLFTGTQGVCSVRLDASSFLISPEGMDNAEIGEEDLVAIYEGDAEKGKEPSLMAAFFYEIYSKNPGIGSAFASQPAHVMAYAASRTEFLTSTVPESYFMLRSIPKRPYEEPIQNPEEAARVFRSATPVVLYENLCLVTTGDTLFTAFDRMEVSEATASAILVAKDVGPVVYLNQDEISELKTTFHLE
ncbi:MAG: class II aldolase/adducin family protein [Eubacteriales bacterium]|nr:class II aldolase/adducin family protein [Eubacteriales bacterium]